MSPASLVEQAAWRVTADTVGGLSFDEYRRSLLHETNDIAAFLAETHPTRYIIAAPKGFGKTLLLIAKRLQLNEHSPEIACQGEFIDRLGGAFSDIGKIRLKQFSSDFQYWRKLWLYSLMTAAINSNGNPTVVADTFLLDRLDPWTKEILLRPTQFRSPALIFTSLLELDYSTRVKAIDSLNKLNPPFNSITSQVAFFIDNVDEYFETILENKSLSHIERNDGSDDKKANNIWIYAQLGLVGAALTLHRTNNHVRVYCTVRQEAYLQLEDVEASYAHIRAATIEINYTPQDLRTIFVKNVALMDGKRLFMEADADDPVGKFFGPKSKRIRHQLVDKKEDAFDFVLRHTFSRPRDIVTICGRIAVVDVEDRTSSEIKRIVEAQSRDLVDGLFSEMKPFFPLPDKIELFACIDRNVLTREDLHAISTKYLSRVEGSLSFLDGDERREMYLHPLCVLFQIGMLGHIVPDRSQLIMDRQRFLSPREIKIAQEYGLPPTHGYYLVHPALDAPITDRVGRDYVRSYYRSSIIGPGLAWTPPQIASFVIKGDAFEFSRIMSQETYAAIAEKLHGIVALSCRDLEFAEITNGDSVTMIDKSADKLLHAVTQLKRRAETEEMNLTFRFGGSAGPIQFQNVSRRLPAGEATLAIPLGQALRASARIEPLAPLDRVVVDDAFVAALGPHQDLFSLTPLSPDDVPKIPFLAETQSFHIQKGPTDPVIETRLYLLATSS